MKCKPYPQTSTDENASSENEAPLRVRIGGFDRRKEMFKGWVEVEGFVYHGAEGSFCVMQRDQVCF